MKKLVKSWGRFLKVKAEIISFSSEGIKIHSEKIIPRGLGKSYGDSSLAENILDLTTLKKIVHFDPLTGIIEIESGVSIREILNFIVHAGWMLPIVPGTADVTIGGAISADIHGKNHMVKGSFSNHIAEMDVMLSSGEVVNCSAAKNSELFFAVTGGMGLIAIILRAKIQLQKLESCYMTEKTVFVKSLSLVIEMMKNCSDEFCVAWLDAFDKNISGIFSSANYATKQEASLAGKGKKIFMKQNFKFNIPFSFPFAILNAAGVNIYNKTRKLTTRQGKKLRHIVDFHFPLDKIKNWNRLYGTAGMVQYQFVLPLENAEQGLKEIFSLMKLRHCESYLAVLKNFGEEGKGILSFPMKGLCLALDFPATEKYFSLMNEMDEVVMKYQGRFYLAKDARLSAEVFIKTQPRINEFLFLKRKYDKEKIFSSLQSRRLLGE